MKKITKKGMRTRNKIFESAIELINDKGYEATSMKDICELSGVGIGTIYHYFDSKPDLLNELVMDETKQIAEQIEQFKGNNLEKLKLVIHLQYGYFKFKHKEILAIYTAHSLLFEAQRSIFSSHTTIVLLKKLLIMGEDSLEFKCKNSPMYVFEIISSLLIGDMISWTTSVQSSLEEEEKVLINYEQNILSILDMLIEK